jgi:chloramphenicol O-acetyltransferase
MNKKMCENALNRQAYCLNCKFIYYTYLMQENNNFCSKDCKSSHNYMDYVNKAIIEIIKIKKTKKLNKKAELNSVSTNTVENTT